MKKRIEIGVIFVILALTIFVLSDNAIWLTDCITYKYNFATWEKIGSIRDIFESQYAHYFSYNGRYVAHWLCQFFISFLSKDVFSAVNALFYIALILLIIRIVTDRALTFRAVLTATCLVMFFCDTNYVPTCQIGFIWMAVFVLIFLQLYFKFAKNPRLSVPTYIGLFFFSILTGNAQEAINIGVGGALIIYTLSNIRHLTVAQWCMTIGFGIGGLFLCLSPGTLGRTEETVISPVYSVMIFLLSLRVTYLFLIILIYKMARGRMALRRFYTDNAFFINAIIILIAFNFLIGVGGSRQLFGIELFSSILVLKLLDDQSFSKPILWIFVFLLTGIYILKYVEIRKADESYKELYAKMTISPTGPLFIDFPSFNPYIQPTIVFRYGVYLDHALTSASCEATGSYSKEAMPCYPAKAEKIFNEPIANRTYQYLPGEFMLMQSKEEPKMFTLYRSINLFGIKVPLSPYNVEFDSESNLNTQDYNILYIPRILPVIENERITIE